MIDGCRDIWIDGWMIHKWSGGGQMDEQMDEWMDKYR